MSLELKISGNQRVYMNIFLFKNSRQSKKADSPRADKPDRPSLTAGFTVLLAINHPIAQITATGANIITIILWVNKIAASERAKTIKYLGLGF
jgi:hypothetical protein